MPINTVITNLGDAVSIAKKIHTHDELKELLPSLNAEQQAWLFTALGSNLTTLMTQYSEFEFIFNRVKNQERFILHLLTHIEGFSQLHRVLINFNLCKPLLLISLTYPEHADTVKNSVARAIGSMHDLMYYAVNIGHCMGLFLIRFLGPTILTLGSRDELLKVQTKFNCDQELTTFVLNSYDYHSEQQDTWFNRVKRVANYSMSLFYTASPNTLLLQPNLLNDFYKFHTHSIMQFISQDATLSPEEKQKKLTSSLRYADYQTIAAALKKNEPDVLSIIIDCIENQADLIRALNEYDLIRRINHHSTSTNNLIAALRMKASALVKTKQDLDYIAYRLYSGIVGECELFFQDTILSITGKTTPSLRA